MNISHSGGCSFSSPKLVTTSNSKLVYALSERPATSCCARRSQCAAQGDGIASSALMRLNSWSAWVLENNFENYLLATAQASDPTAEGCGGVGCIGDYTVGLIPGGFWMHIVGCKWLRKFQRLKRSKNLWFCRLKKVQEIRNDLGVFIF